MAVTSIYVALLILGVGMLVRGLMTVSTARATWMVRSVAGTGRVTACKPIQGSSTDPFNTFSIAITYTDTRGHAYTAKLPASQQFQAGDPVDIRFDPKHPATVYLSEQFAGSNLPFALIAFGGALILVSFISLAQ
jgi:hypothetical protein